VKVNPTDPDSLKEFFTAFRGLSNPELAILAGRTPDTIRKWRKKCDEEIYRDPFVEWRSKQVKQVKPKITRPELWDCAEWFKEQYEKKGRGVATISGIINKNPKFTYYRLKKYGVKIRSYKEATKSDNPCCDEDWLYYHYSRREEYLKWCKKNHVDTDKHGGMALPLRECAELAGVVPYTITNWLTRFKIRIRGITESSMLNLTDADRRVVRDRYFELYRKGKCDINGIRVDKKKIRGSQACRGDKESRRDRPSQP